MIATSPILVAIATISSGVSNLPYARSHVSSTDPNSHCLWWAAGPVVYNQSAVGNPVNGGTEFPAVTRSWQSWQTIQSSCGNLTLSEGPHISGSAGRTVGYSQGSSNDNVVMFRQTLCSNAAPPGDPCFSAQTCNNAYDCWGNANTTIGLTTTTYRVSTGQILDADIEFNAAVFHFTTADGPICSGGNYSNCVSTDVQNTATHEFGHSLGLDHTTFCGSVDGGTMCSVMSPNSTTGETSKRTIDPWSASFICDAYPQGRPSQDCALSAANQGTNAGSSSGCAAVPGSLAWPLAVLCIFLVRRKIVRA
jgi:hypothetical protein